MTRAYIAGFGTAGSLLACAAVLFVIATAVVSYRGWPELADAGPSPALVLPHAPQYGVTASISKISRGTVTAAVPPVSTHTAAGSAPRHKVAAAPRTSSAPTTFVAGVPRGVTRHESTPPPATTVPVTPAAPATTCTTCTTSATGALGGVATSATGSLGAGVASAGQQVGNTVGAVSGALASQLSAASPAVGGLVGAVGQALDTAVAQVTSAAGGAVTGTGQALGGILGSLGQH